MNPAPRSTQIHRKTARVTLAILCAVAVVGLTQCKLASDKVTGLDRAHTPPGQCISACAHAANEAKKSESELHVLIVQACAGDEACLAQEQARHEAAVEAIHAEKKRCMDGCHQQGGGSGR